MSAPVYDLLLNDDGDLDIQYGDLVIATGADAVRQTIRSNLLFFKGEWFLDEDVGVPYWDDILIKNPRVNVIRELVRQVIINSDGVDSVESLEVVYDSALRSATVTFSAVMDDGSLLQVDGLQL